MKYDIYLASGWFTNNQKTKMEIVLDALRSANFSVFAPCESEFNLRQNDRLDRNAAKQIFADDCKGINSSTMMLAIYDECDSGTMMEIGYACGIGKDVVVVSSEEFMNLMISVPVKGCYHSFKELVDVLKTANTTEDIIANASEWKKDNF